MKKSERKYFISDLFSMVIRKILKAPKHFLKIYM